MSLELYTIICALWLFWSLACVITLPVIADCLWIFTVYCFCIPLIDVTVIVISLVVTVLKSICLVLLPLVFSFPSTDTKANSCVAIAFKSTFVCVAFTFTSYTPSAFKLANFPSAFTSFKLTSSSSLVSSLTIYNSYSFCSSAPFFAIIDTLVTFSTKSTFSLDDFTLNDVSLILTFVVLEVEIASTILLTLSLLTLAI